MAEPSRRTARTLGITGVVLAFVAPALHARSSLIGSDAHALQPAEATVAAAVVMIAALVALTLAARRRANDRERRDPVLPALLLFVVTVLWLGTVVISIVRLIDEGYADPLTRTAVAAQVLATSAMLGLAVVARRRDSAADRAS
ncbi:hypothetical protein CLV46_2840 [Diaminobutyricimonas aerilata]|uniref:Uncharacterized protein n=1 Tax=Diaminobutyricimonas aerilata TaxID=1162967 RepID=A0A2M9CN24_9MICO|nr:hypothetical protein [Diaminobutyricimonas aerilata]PJJ73254.1 hypothetical protein CLV46_2840 [Diaminobutyricimonas aerilata]